MGSIHNECMDSVRASNMSPADIPSFCVKFANRRGIAEEDIYIKTALDSLSDECQITASLDGMSLEEAQMLELDSIVDVAPLNCRPHLGELQSALNDGTLLRFPKDIELCRKGIINDASLNDAEKSGLLTVCSIAMSSYEYTIEPQLATGNLQQRYKNILRADAIGAARGAIGALINGIPIMIAGGIHGVAVVAGRAVIIGGLRGAMNSAMAWMR